MPRAVKSFVEFDHLPAAMCVELNALRLAALGDPPSTRRTGNYGDGMNGRETDGLLIRWKRTGSISAPLPAGNSPVIRWPNRCTNWRVS